MSDEVLVNIRFDPETGEYRYTSVVYDGQRVIFASGDVVADFNEAIQETKPLAAKGYDVYPSDWTEYFLEANAGAYRVRYGDEGLPVLERRLTLAA